MELVLATLDEHRLANEVVPIVIMTSSREEQDLVRSYHLGVSSYLVKPVKFQEFVDSSGAFGQSFALNSSRLLSPAELDFGEDMSAQVIAGFLDITVASATRKNRHSFEKGFDGFRIPLFECIDLTDAAQGKPLAVVVLLLHRRRRTIPPARWCFPPSPSRPCRGGQRRDLCGGSRPGPRERLSAQRRWNR